MFYSQNTVYITSENFDAGFRNCLWACCSLYSPPLPDRKWAMQAAIAKYRAISPLRQIASSP